MEQYTRERKNVDTIQNHSNKKYSVSTAQYIHNTYISVIEIM